MEDSIWNTTERQLKEAHPDFLGTLNESYWIINGIVIPNYHGEGNRLKRLIKNPFLVEEPYITFRDGLWYFISALSPIVEHPPSLNSLAGQSHTGKSNSNRHIFFNEKDYFFGMLKPNDPVTDPFLLYYKEDFSGLIMFDVNSGLEFTTTSEGNSREFGITGLGKKGLIHQLEATITDEPGGNRFGLSKSSYDDTGRLLSEQHVEQILIAE